MKNRPPALITIRSPAGMYPRALRLMHWLILVALSLTTIGCQRMKSTNQTNVPQDANGAVHIDTSKPIPFDRHNFGAFCYDAYGCKVRYGHMPTMSRSNDVKEISSAELGERYPGAMYAGYLGFRNFPPPAEVSWRSKDGQAHTATVDLASIFKDQIVLHRVPLDQLPPILTAPVYPEIILEVNDRTINVYMRAVVRTRGLQIPGNRHSRFRDDLILAYTRTY